MAVISELMLRNEASEMKQDFGDIERIDYALRLPDLTPPPAASTAEASDILILDGFPR
jgi:hypothetical protein